MRAPVVGWACASLVYTAWVWLVVVRMDSQATATHAVREDPSRAMADLLVLAASLASLGAGASSSSKRGSRPAPGKEPWPGWPSPVWCCRGCSCIRSSPCATRVSTSATMWRESTSTRRIRPHYTDFAYLAFSVGMTFQVSDTRSTSWSVSPASANQARRVFLWGRLRECCVDQGRSSCAGRSVLDLPDEPTAFGPQSGNQCRSHVNASGASVGLGPFPRANRRGCRACSS